jgi:predicted HicB family RNase H-like nuclease
MVSIVRRQNMSAGVKITQLRLEAELYEAVREQAYERRQSRNQFMSEAIRDKVEKIRMLEG